MANFAMFLNLPQLCLTPFGCACVRMFEAC